MTPCVLEAYDKMFGSDYNNVVDLKMALTYAAGGGKDALTKLTGCKQPCKGTKYKKTLQETFQIEHKFNFISKFQFQISKFTAPSM